MSTLPTVLAGRVYVAGADTLIGGAIHSRLGELGCAGLLAGPGREPDLTKADEVRDFLALQRPSHIVVAAGLSGGIEFNRRHPAELILHNLQVAVNLIPAAREMGVRRLLYLASSCTYPRLAGQPLEPGQLWSGALEPTNQAYAAAKLAGLELCRAFRQQHDADFITGIPANAFGPGDDFSPDNSHVIAALMGRMHQAKLSGLEEVVIWGSGRPLREFIFADDLADAALFALEHYAGEAPLNLGGGLEYAIGDLARLTREVVGYKGRLVFDTAKPDGMPRKVLDSSALKALGWRPAWDMRAALAATYQWYLENLS